MVNRIHIKHGVVIPFEHIDCVLPCFANEQIRNVYTLSGQCVELAAADFEAEYIYWLNKKDGQVLEVEVVNPDEFRR